MEGPRAPHENEFTGLVNFLNTELRPREGWSIDTEYPMAFSHSNISNIRIITDEKRDVLSHAVLRPLIMKTPAGLFKIAAIGSVVTSSTHRNQGLSRQIVESCLSAASNHGCDFAILWTDLYDFYRKMGFELAGSEVAMTLHQEIHPPADGLRFMDTNKVAADAIHRVYSQHTVCSMRTLEETAKYLQIPNMRVYTAWDTNGALKAYAVEGKGADLNGFIHEWGGGVRALLGLFAHIRKVQNRPIAVIAPAHSKNLIRQMTELGATTTQGFLGMIKILHADALFAKVRKYARNLGLPNVELSQEGAIFRIAVGDSVYTTDSEADIVRLIFGPLQPSSHPAFDKDAAEILDQVLPLPMWVWGWDSI